MSCKRQRMRRREIEKGLITGRLFGAGAWAAGRGPSSWSRSPGGPTAPPGAWGARRAARRWRGWRGCEVAARGAAESARTRCTAAASCSPCASAPPTRRRSPAPTPSAPQTVHSPDFRSLRSLMCYTGWGTKSHCCSCPTARGSWRWVLGSGTPRERGWRTARSPVRRGNGRVFSERVMSSAVSPIKTQSLKPLSYTLGEGMAGPALETSELLPDSKA